MTIDEQIVKQVMDVIEKMSAQEILEDLQLLVPLQVSKKLGIGKSTVYTLYNQGELPGFKVGGRLRFRPRALLAYIMLKEIAGKPLEAVAA